MPAFFEMSFVLHSAPCRILLYIRWMVVVVVFLLVAVCCDISFAGTAASVPATSHQEERVAAKDMANAATRSSAKSSDNEQGFDSSLLWKIGIPVFFFLLLLLCRNWCLRKEINRRRVAEKRFILLIESIPDAMIITDASGEITLVNSQAETLFGYDRKELLHQPVEMLIPEPARSKHVALREAFTKNPSVRQMDALSGLQGRTKEGRIFPADIGISPLQTDTGLAIVVSMRDVTDWKKAETALAEAEEQNRLLLESVGEGILGVDTNGDITFINPAAEKLLGFTSQEIINQSIHERILHSRSDGTVETKESSPIYLTYRQGIRNHFYDEVLWRKDGTCFSAEYHTTPIHKNDSIIGAVVTFNDISERVKIEEELKKNMQDLQRFSQLAVGREKNMIELKKEINTLLSDLGKEPKYKVVSNTEK